MTAGCTSGTTARIRRPHWCIASPTVSPMCAARRCVAPRRSPHQGAFATAAQLALYGIADLPLAAPPVIFAVTGSSGAGQALKPTTHHPARAHNMFAYSGMGHRHEGEMLEQWRAWRHDPRRTPG